MTNPENRTIISYDIVAITSNGHRSRYDINSEKWLDERGYDGRADIYFSQDEDFMVNVTSFVDSSDEVVKIFDKIPKEEWMDSFELNRNLTLWVLDTDGDWLFVDGDTETIAKK